MEPVTPRATLFHRLFALYAAMLALATAVLVLAPVTVSVPTRLGELAVILAGVVVMSVAYRSLLRRALAPLERLSDVMRRVDPLSPGERVPTDARDAEVASLAAAFNDMLDRLEAERKDSVGRALAAQEGERLRVAQELHDGVGQTLTGVVLQLGRVARDLPEPWLPGVSEAQETARESLEEVRRIARRLRPEALDDLGLASALHVLGERVAEHSELRVDVHVQPGLPEFSAEEELVLYRVAQEALTNVARHADAGRAEVRLERAGGRTRLEVDDDGRGLPRAAHEGGGVRGMRERAVLIGGALRLARSPLGGTRVTLELG
jgi:two-component system sensor histidine kinase UhpB